MNQPIGLPGMLADAQPPQQAQQAQQTQQAKQPEIWKSLAQIIMDETMGANSAKQQISATAAGRIAEGAQGLGGIFGKIGGLNG